MIVRMNSLNHLRIVFQYYRLSMLSFIDMSRKSSVQTQLARGAQFTQVTKKRVRLRFALDVLSFV